MDLEGKNNGLKFDQDLVGISRDVEGSLGKIHRVSKFTESLRVLRRMLPDIEGQSRELIKIHSSRDLRKSETRRTAA